MKKFNIILVFILFLPFQSYSQKEDGAKDQWLEYQSCIKANLVSIIKNPQLLENIIFTKQFKNQNDLLYEIANNYSCEFKSIMKNSVKQVFDILPLVEAKSLDKVRKSHDLQLYFSIIFKKKYAEHYKLQACLLTNNETDYVDLRLLMKPSLKLIQLYNTEIVRSCENKSGCLQSLDFQYLFAMSVLLFEPSLIEYIKPEILRKSYLLISENKVPSKELIYIQSN